MPDRRQVVLLTCRPAGWRISNEIRTWRSDIPPRVASSRTASMGSRKHCRIDPRQSGISAALDERPRQLVRDGVSTPGIVLIKVKASRPTLERPRRGRGQALSAMSPHRPSHSKSVPLHGAQRPLDIGNQTAQIRSTRCRRTKGLLIAPKLLACILVATDSRIRRQFGGTLGSWRVSWLRRCCRA